MKNALKIAAIIAGICTFPTHADVTLSYEISGPDMEKISKKFSLARFFARIDDPAQPDSYLLYQTGKFFPLYRVNTSAGTYTRLTPEVKVTLHAGVAQKPEPTQEMSAGETVEKEKATAEASATTESTVKASGTQATTMAAEQTAVVKASDNITKSTQDKPKTSLRLTKKNKKIAGIRCRVVEELEGEQTIMTHCMADKARIGITEREVRSLARLFKMARDRNFGWLGTTTPDEKFVSIASQDLRNKKTLQLKAVSTKPLAAGYLRVPRDYKQVPLE